MTDDISRCTELDDVDGLTLVPPEAGAASSQAYVQLKQDVLSFRFGPGMPLQEADLAQRYGGSRTPTREALRRLVQEGLIVRRGRNYIVRVFTPAEVRDLYEVREGIEKMATRLTIERASDEELAVLDRQIAAQEQHAAGGDAAGFNLLDTRFHLCVARLTRNTFLFRQMALLHDQVMLVRKLELSRQQGMFNAINDHHRIVGAMKRRDIEVAEAEMRYHVRSVIALYYGTKEPQPGSLSRNAAASGDMREHIA